SEAIGYTNSFMASCGAPPSSLIIMNLLATSVFTHYNTVSPIKDFDVTPPKVNSTDIVDTMSIKSTTFLADKVDINTNNQGTLNEIEITHNKALLGESQISGFQANKGASGAKVLDLKNPKSFEGSSIKDVESYLDDVLSGFEKKPLKKGEGIRYYDGKGNSWQLNYGYENAVDAVHGNPYLKTTINGEIVRVPLK
ncbi:MAG: hypothetical protein RR546_07765, partial [Erysipelotrichaceae bacterium]